ncbi:MurR/RpiR family transcriptional regulator [Porcincola intestinalis]|uniref:MurR/RpiR family transcriptional regulator n=1 Tax=Porcincola intestinalis TaxID=2606632 RepID=UPI0023F086C5|nr:MurR/RpiR family transcriptional regulator [Porcincola intestinalis]MCI6767141.1 MurR/RpiR family transcriptional regulator [Lachnospiraceae bacterium]MDD7061206.1 MurR/RpiR family transcriptional regulator [Porcincola intestinalis]MDY5283583.1 MurR/RpiR family transcriptional regulator [Porcincola intestinalis]
MGCSERRRDGGNLFLGNGTKQVIKEAFSSMTHVEKSVARFFLNNTAVEDFSSKNIAALLYISESTLSRFAKKCGFRGYREFVFSYEKDFHEEMEYVKSHSAADFVPSKVHAMYTDATAQEFQESQIEQWHDLARIIRRSRAVYMTGSGCADALTELLEYQLVQRGLPIEIVHRTQLLQLHARLATEGELFIGIDMDGKDILMRNTLTVAVENGARSVLISSEPVNELKNSDIGNLCISSGKTISGGHISCVVPYLVMLDLLLMYCEYERDRG